MDLMKKLAKNNETEAKKPLRLDKALSEWARTLTGQLVCSAKPGHFRRSVIFITL